MKVSSILLFGAVLALSYIKVTESVEVSDGATEDEGDQLGVEEEFDGEAPRGRGSHRHRNGGPRGHHGRGADRGRAQKINKLCRMVSTSVSQIIRHFLKEKANQLQPDIRQQVTAYLTTKKQQVSECCELTGSEKSDCFEILKRNRYDSVCNNEEPLCIWAFAKGVDSNSAATTTNCCSKEGDERYTCFTEAKKSYQRRGRRNRNKNAPEN